MFWKLYFNYTNAREQYHQLFKHHHMQFRPYSNYCFKKMFSWYYCCYYQLFLAKCSSPRRIEKATVSPQLKNQNTNSLSNYRPLSHLSFLSKILERLSLGNYLNILLYIV